MPCYYTGSREGDLSLSLEEARKSLTKTTRLFCSALHHLDEGGSLDTMPKEVLKWWKKHKKIDARAERWSNDELA